MLPGRVLSTLLLLLPCVSRRPSRMRQEQEPGLWGSSPDSALRSQMTKHLLLVKQNVCPSPCLSPPQWGKTGGYGEKCTGFWSWAEISLTCSAPVTTCGLEMVPVLHADHFKKHKGLLREPAMALLGI